MIRTGGLLAPGGMILLHDTGEPWARGDLYYEPERIPADAKLPDAPHGVLTAVEAFVAASPLRWLVLRWRAEHGLTCLVSGSSLPEAATLRLKCFLWRFIRWRNRLLRLLGLKPTDSIAWGKEQPSR